MNVAARPCLQADEYGVDGGTGEHVRVFAWREAIAQAERRGAVYGGEQQPEDRLRRRPLRARAGVDRLLDALDHVVLHLADEAEALPVTADARHAAIEEHQREVLGMFLAELVVAQEHGAQFLDRVVRHWPRRAAV